MSTAVTRPPASHKQATVRVALAGNPNTGKSTLFNRLTGIHQRTGNYPGVTIEKKVGSMRVHDRTVEVLDLPGTYSLAASSIDERIVVDVLTGRIDSEDRPDVVVCVVDATNIMRHLFLASQIADAGLPIIIALNLMDHAHQQGLAIDVKLLSERLGVPVVPTVASRGQGVDELRRAISEALNHPPIFNTVTWPAAVGEAIDYLRESLPPHVSAELTDAELQRLLFDRDSAVGERLDWSPAQRRTHIRQARQKLEAAGHDPYSMEPMLRYAHLAQLMDGVVTRPVERRATGTESIDAILTHRLWGLVIFTLMMFGVFWSIYTGAGPAMDAIDAGFGRLGENVSGWLAPWPMLNSLVTDGLIAGVGSVVIFLPQILILFFFIALLDDTGYMPRAAYLMDKLFAWCGLNGRSFVPLLSCYACAIPGVMATRTIDNPRARLTTILIAPLMSCSARLPVYVLLIGAFIEPHYGATVAAVVLFAMHLVGLVVAMPIALILNRLIFRTRRSPFVMEMPAYRVPMLRDVVWRMWEKGKDFLVNAGTVIFAISILIWALSYFPRSATVEQEVTQRMQAEGIDDPAVIDGAVQGAYLEQSYLGRMGKFVQPIFAPAGFDWRITVGVLASFPAREVIVSTLGITYNLGGEVDEADTGLSASLRSATWPDGSPVFNIPVAVAVMVFFALCLQCMATMAVIGREVGWKWSALAFTYMTTLAWIGAVGAYQIGMAIGAAA